MGTPLEDKSSVSDIRKRFDKDVERFSNLETGQSAIMDAPLAMELITKAAIASGVFEDPFRDQSTSLVKLFLRVGGYRLISIF